jgi:hypothetical protein
MVARRSVVDADATGSKPVSFEIGDGPIAVQRLGVEHDLTVLGRSHRSATCHVTKL